MSTTVLQNINLYLPEFRKKNYWLTAEKMALVASAGVLLLVVATGVEIWQLVQLRGDLADKEQEHQQIAAATEALIAQYGVQTEDPALLDSIQKLETDLQSQQALLQFLEGRELGNTVGFSEYMADLSRYHLQGLSLTYVGLSDGGRSIELSGKVLKPDLVTLYLQNLRKGGTYTGKSFEMMQIDDEPAPESGESEPTTNGPAVWNFRVRSLEAKETTTRGGAGLAP